MRKVAKNSYRERSCQWLQDNIFCSSHRITQLQKIPSFATVFNNVRHFIGKFTFVIAFKNVVKDSGEGRCFL